MIRCPECGSNKVKNNGHNEIVCKDCGDCFWPVDQHQEAKELR